MEALGRHLVAAVPGRKQPPRPIQKLLGPSFGLLVRMLFRQKPDVAYQVSPTILGLDPKVPGERTVGREVVEVQIAGELRPDQLFQHFPRTRRGNVKDAERRRRDAPNPVLLAVVFDACLVAAKLFLLAESLRSVRRKRPPAMRRSSPCKAWPGSRARRDLQHVFHPRFDGRITAVADRLEPTDRCQQPRPEDRTFQFGAGGNVEVGHRHPGRRPVDIRSHGPEFPAVRCAG